MKGINGKGIKCNRAGWLGQLVAQHLQDSIMKHCKCMLVLSNTTYCIDEFHNCIDEVTAGWADAWIPNWVPLSASLRNLLYKLSEILRIQFPISHHTERTSLTLCLSSFTYARPKLCHSGLKMTTSWLGESWSWTLEEIQLRYRRHA